MYTRQSVHLPPGRHTALDACATLVFFFAFLSSAPPRFSFLLLFSLSGMMLTWACRCLPGFSLIALALLLLLAFSDVLNAPRWKGVFVPPSYSPAKDGAWSSLSRAQQCFVVYAILVHLHMFGFTLRLSWSLFRVFKKTKHAFERRITETPPVSPASSRSSWSSRQDYSEKHPSESIIEKPSVMVEEIAEQQEVIHAIILPNYGEDLNTLETTLNVLASHPRAQSQYEVSPLSPTLLKQC